MSQVQPAMAQKDGNNSLVSQAIAAEARADRCALKGVAHQGRRQLLRDPSSRSRPAARRATMAPRNAQRSPGTSPRAWRAPSGIATRNTRSPTKLKYTETVLPTMGCSLYGRIQPAARQLRDVRRPRRRRICASSMRASPTLLLAAARRPQERRRHGPAEDGQPVAAGNLR